MSEQAWSAEGYRMLSLAVINSAVEAIRSPKRGGIHDQDANEAAVWLETTGLEWLAILRVGINEGRLLTWINRQQTVREVDAALRDWAGTEAEARK